MISIRGSSLGGPRTWVWPILLGFVFMRLTAASLWASDKASVAGCVVDAAGKPAVGVRVIARRADEQSFSTKETRTKKPTGCYEFRNLATGVYWLSVDAGAFEMKQFNPVQAKVALYSGREEQANLTTALPDSELLRAGILRSLKAARPGFRSEKVGDVAPYYADLGTGFAANILSGFGECTVHYRNAGAGPTAAEVCTLRGLKKEADTGAAFSAIAASVRAALESAPNSDFRPTETELTCDAPCTTQLAWVSPTSGAAVLRQERQRVQLWLLFNQRLSADGCSALGASSDVDSKSLGGKYEFEMAAISSEIIAHAERYFSMLRRNLLRLALTGGNLEGPPEPMAMAEYPEPERTASCGEVSWR